MKFSFVLLTWNRYKFLEKCLEALTRSLHTASDYEIVVMNNGSTDQTMQVLSRYAGFGPLRTIVRRKNYGINAYKKLLAAAKGDSIVIVDDDVLEFPERIDAIFTEYMESFPDYGFLALNVVQNEFTNGAKPGPEAYTLDTCGGRTIERGPTGGWCSCLRKRDYRKLRWKIFFSKMDMARGEDSFLAGNLKRWLSLDSGIIRDAVCFHASGPYYARQYGHLDREIQKYSGTKLDHFVKEYESYRPGGTAAEEPSK